METNPRLVLEGTTAKNLFEPDPGTQQGTSIAQRVASSISSSTTPQEYLSEIGQVGNAALLLFLQSNITGPTLDWDPAVVVKPELLLTQALRSDESVSIQLARSLSIDGESVYPYIPHLELFVLAKNILNSECFSNDIPSTWARLRVNTWHQRLLSQPAPSLQTQIENDLSQMEDLLASAQAERNYVVEFLLESAATNLLHGRENKAKADLTEATKKRKFEFALTGRLGKRTKFQEKDVSQLVVLAKSFEGPSNDDVSVNTEKEPPVSQPNQLDLEDDTLLESIAFVDSASSKDGVQAEDNLSPVLAALDPNNQPVLNPLDAIILLDTASAIAGSAPQDGLAREETLPYAERALSGGSSNWQIYTQALLVRSRIEGHRTRTMERGVLQLQAIVDQVIAETASRDPNGGLNDAATNGTTQTFLPRPRESEMAPAAERLRYIHQLASPMRWNLEAELANRWVAIGGLKTALEIYERLQMWAEAALCLAANDREDQAREMIRKQLYAPSKKDIHDGEDQMSGKIAINSPSLKDPLPADAPRLFCILGDIDANPSFYERAWEISKYRYSRAQRSLGRYYMKKGEFTKADASFVLSLQINPQNHPSWFALGCARLQTEDWHGAVEAFGRAVQIEDTDAESWSNMAVALLNMPEEDESAQKNIRGAFTAMKRATSHKRDNVKLWQNLLAVAIKLSPPPYADVVMAQTRLIALLGPPQGERAVDVPVVEALLSLVFEEDSTHTDQDKEVVRAGSLRKLITDLLLQKVAPLITSSGPLWRMIARLDIHLNRPFAALTTYEKAWRSALNQPGWEADKKTWKNVSNATIEVVDAYESLGDKEREFGLAAGEPVCKDWKFKARSAIRSVLARAREGWEDDEEYEHLKERLDELKGG